MEFTDNSGWIVEGVFENLLEIALARATELVWLNLSWEACREGLLRRGPHYRMDPRDPRALQDWGGPIGSAFALRNPDRVDRICVCSTMVMGSRPEGITGPMDYLWFNWTLTDEFEPTIRNLGATVLSVMKRIGFERTAHIDETWIRAYSAPFSHA